MSESSAKVDPFATTYALIRDFEHVRVERLAAEDGRRCKFKKVFKSAGIDDAGYWMQRENKFLLDFSVKELKHVVQMAEVVRNDEQDQHKYKSVTTVDAGVTLEYWLTVKPRFANGVTWLHPFQHADAFLQLVKACLIALREIHKIGIIHCDIKPDNICLPYEPYPYQPDTQIRIDYAQIRLIDFAFSITRERPLKKSLPIEPIASYQSHSLKAALSKDQKLRRGKLAIQEIDYRADLYSLGHLARKIYNTGLLQPAGDSGQEAVNIARQVVEKLEACNSSNWLRGWFLPHDGLIAKIDNVQKKLTGSEACQSFVITRAPEPISGPSLSDQKKPVLEPTPVIKFPSIIQDNTPPIDLSVYSLLTKLESWLSSQLFIYSFVGIIVGALLVAIVHDPKNAGGLNKSTQEARLDEKAIEQIKAKFTCSDLKFTVDQNNKSITWTGYVKRQGDVLQLEKETNQIVDFKADVSGIKERIWPLCEAVELMDQYHSKNKGLSISTNPPSLNFKEDVPFFVEVFAPKSSSAYLYVDYFAHTDKEDGQVLHMFSGQQDSQTSMPIKIGTDNSGKKPWYMGGPPYGEELIVVIRTSKRLFTDKLDTQESAKSYLKNLRESFSHFGPSDQIDTDYKFIMIIKK